MKSDLNSMMTSHSPLLQRGRLLLKHEGLGAFPFAKARSAAYLIDRALAAGENLLRVTDRSSGSWGMGLATAVQAIPDEVTREVVIITVGPPDPIVLATVHGAGGRFIQVAANEDRITALNGLLQDGWWSPDQHNNECLVDAFAATLGAELVKDLALANIPIEALAYVVAPVGTGGTLAGVTKALREAAPEARFASIGVDGNYSILHQGPQAAVRPDSRAAGIGSLDEVSTTFQFASQWIDNVVGVDCFRAQQELLHAFELVPAGFGMSSAYALAYARHELLELAAASTPRGYVLALLPDGIARYGKELATAISLITGTD